MGTSYITIILGLFITIFLFYKLPKISDKKDDGVVCSHEERQLTISIIIPARNEEYNLPNILGDLMKQNYPIHEIICVDDGSTDKTPEIIKEFEDKGKFKVRGIGVEKLPEGWKGKTWACQSGARKARGDFLLFIDSDVRLSSDSISCIVERSMKTGKPLSVQPYHYMEKRYEYFSLFFNLIQTCATGMSIFGKIKTQGFYGPLFFIKAEVFNRFGGYEKVKNDVIEDFDLGKILGENGVEVDLLLGSEDIRFRMYPRSFRDLLEGWSKNFSKGSFSMKIWLFLVIILWIGYLTILPFELIKACMSGLTGSTMILSIIYVISVSLLYNEARKLGSYPLWTCIVYPVYLLFFHLVYLYSFIGTFFLKTTTWKGRKL